MGHSPELLTKIICKINKDSVSTSTEMGELRRAGDYVTFVNSDKMRNEHAVELSDYIFDLLKPQGVWVFDAHPAAIYKGDIGLKIITSSSFDNRSLSDLCVTLEPSNFITGIAAAMITLCEVSNLPCATIIAVDESHGANEDTIFLFDPIRELLGWRSVSYFKALSAIEGKRNITSIYS